MSSLTMATEEARSRKEEGETKVKREGEAKEVRAKQQGWEMENAQIPKRAYHRVSVAVVWGVTKRRTCTPERGHFES